MASFWTMNSLVMQGVDVAFDVEIPVDNQITETGNKQVASSAGIRGYLALSANYIVQSSAVYHDTGASASKANNQLSTLQGRGLCFGIRLWRVETPPSHSFAMIYLAIFCIYIYISWI